MGKKTISLATSNTITISAAVIFLIAGFLTGSKSLQTYISTSSPFGSAGQVAEDDHEDEEEAEHDGHGHEEEVSLEELESVNCEHDMAAANCAECRFEVGVVKIERESVDALIETGTVENIERLTRLNFTGQVQLDRTRTVKIAPSGGGRIEKIEKFLGDKVLKGEVLAVIHSNALGEAKADYLERRSALELAQATLEREKALYEKKISSHADYLAALNQFNAAQASITAVDKRLGLFGLETEQIAAISSENQNGTFADLVVRAPQEGTIIAMDVSVGQIVDTTQALCTVSDLTSLWVWCDVYEKDLAFLHEQKTAESPLEALVKVKAFEKNYFTGLVDYIGNSVDEFSRTVKMRVQVENSAQRLRPGMFADVEIAIPQAGHALAVLRTAVMEDDGEFFIFRHWKEDLWARRDITIGERYGEYVEVLSGAELGAEIVTGGAFMLKSDVLREKMGAGCAD